MKLLLSCSLLLLFVSLYAFNGDDPVPTTERVETTNQSAPVIYQLVLGGGKVISFKSPKDVAQFLLSKDGSDCDCGLSGSTSNNNDNGGWNCSMTHGVTSCVCNCYLE